MKRGSKSLAMTFASTNQILDVTELAPVYALNGCVVSGSEEILTDLLREEMGFSGITVSDYSALSNMYHVQRMGESPADTGRLGLTAGMDQELPQPCCYNGELLERIGHGAKGILTALREALPDAEILYGEAYPMCGNDTSMHEEALELCRDAELVIAVLGSKYGFGKVATTGEGPDTTDINLAQS